MELVTVEGKRLSKSGKSWEITLEGGKKVYTKELADKLTVGQKYEAEIAKDNKYGIYWLNEANPVTGNVLPLPVTTPPVHNAQKSNGNASNLNDLKETRYRALMCVCTLLRGSPDVQGITAPAIIGYAMAFEDYINGK